jgi:hypothetical protein
MVGDNKVLFYFCQEKYDKNVKKLERKFNNWYIVPDKAVLLVVEGVLLCFVILFLHHAKKMDSVIMETILWWGRKRRETYPPCCRPARQR